MIVGSQWGDVYALDRATGCIRWSYGADAAVRGAISVADDQEGRRLVYLTDYLANVYALAASDGALVRQAKVGRHKDAVVTGSVAAHEGRVFVPLSSMELASAMDPTYPLG